MIEKKNDFIKLVVTLESYNQHVKDNKIPIYIKNRNDLAVVIDEYLIYKNFNDNFSRADFFLVLNEDEDMRSIKEVFFKLAKSEITSLTDAIESEKIVSNDTLLVICKYNNFNQEIVNEMIKICSEKNIHISFITGRDMQSITWLIAKQFFEINSKNKSALLTHKRLSKGMKKRFADDFEKINYEILDVVEMGNEKIMKNIFQKNYNKMVFHTHGKEDHLNLGNFTICGKNSHINSCVNQNRPRCGYGCGSCFKDDDKLVYANAIKADTVVLLSCNNAPFFENIAYAMKYNIFLNFIDGFASNVIGASTVINVEWRDFVRLSGNLDESNFMILNEYIKQKMGHVPLINFGMPSKYKKQEMSNVSINKNIYKALNSTLKLIGSETIDDEKLLKRMHNFVLLAKRHVHYQNICVTQIEQDESDKKFIERIREMDKKYAEYLSQNTNNDIFNVGEVALSSD
ncbi:MAG: hypothetical protein ACRC5R_04225, partial [Mycoplasmatales bacterium]